MDLDKANNMWALYKHSQKDAKWAALTVDKKIGRLQNAGFSEFILKYSVPTRYMVMYGEYSSKAFARYLARLKAVGYNSKSDWVDRQADYVKMLWQCYNVHGNNAEAIAQWQHARITIKKEMDDFEQDFESAKQLAEQSKKQSILDDRQSLRDRVGTPAARMLHMMCDGTVMPELHRTAVAVMDDSDAVGLE